MPKWIKEHGVFGGIAGAILTVIVSLIIAFIPNNDENGVSIGGDINIAGDSSITGSGDININKTVSDDSDRIISIQKRLRNLKSQDDPVISYLIQKAKDAFYANTLDEAEKILEEIEIKQRAKP